MSQWNIPLAKEVLNDQTLGLLEAQELMLLAYTEEQDKWDKDMIELERSISIKEKEIHNLINTKDKWWQVVLSRLHLNKTSRQIKLVGIQKELDNLYNRYSKRVSEMPDVDRFELGMYVGRLFRGK